MFIKTYYIVVDRRIEFDEVLTEPTSKKKPKVHRVLPGFEHCAKLLLT